MVRGHDEVRQHRLFCRLRSGCGTGRQGKGCRLADDAIRSKCCKEIELVVTGFFSAAVGKIDDLTLRAAFDRRMRGIDEALQSFGKPVIAPRLALVAVHALLDDHPMAVIGDDEAVQIEIETILHRCAIYLGDQATCLCKAGTVKAGAITDRHQFVRRLA